MGLRIFSYGGGVQSTAALVLASQGAIDFPIFCFSNVGEDSENPATLAYVHDMAMPFAAAHGIELVEIRKKWRDKQERTLIQWVNQSESSVYIPAHLGSGQPGRRKCTSVFKILPLAKFSKARGATPENPAVRGLGISLDEWQRMRTDSGIKWERLEYPLIDLQIDRAQCQAIIARAGLPVPPKSACFFCPFHSKRQWQELRQDQPVLFAEAVALEKTINRRRAGWGKDDMFLHSSLRPLEKATSEHRQLELFDDTEGGCESGYCMV